MNGLLKRPSQCNLDTMAHWCVRDVDYESFSFLPSSDPGRVTDPLKQCINGDPSPSLNGDAGHSGENGHDSPTQGAAARDGVSSGGALAELHRALCTPEGRKRIPGIVANWPHHTLRLCEAVSPEYYQGIIKASSPPSSADELWTLLFEGLLRLDGKSQLRQLDLSNFEPSKGLLYLFLQVAPLLTLDKSHLETSYILEKVTNNLVLANGPLLQPLKGFIETVVKHRVFHRGRGIAATPERPLEVKLDSVPLAADSMLFLSLVTHIGLRDIIGLHVTPRSIHCSFPKIETGNSTLDPFLPLKIIRTHFSKIVEGLFISDLPVEMTENLFESPSVLSDCSSITRLGLANCNLVLADKDPLTEDILSCLSSLPHLSRLDLSDSEICGCLGHVLNACVHSLEYLNLARCRLFASDVIALAQSAHAHCLLDLNLADVFDETLEPPSDELMETVTKQLSYFPGLVSVNISNSHMSSEAVTCLVDSLESLTQLKNLVVDGVPFSEADLWTVLETAVMLPSLQRLSLSRSSSGHDSKSSINGEGTVSFLERVARIRNGDRFLAITDGVFTVKSVIHT